MPCSAASASAAVLLPAAGFGGCCSSGAATASKSSRWYWCGAEPLPLGGFSILGCTADGSVAVSLFSAVVAVPCLARAAFDSSAAAMPSPVTSTGLVSHIIPLGQCGGSERCTESAASIQHAMMPPEARWAHLLCASSETEPPATSCSLPLTEMLKSPPVLRAGVPRMHSAAAAAAACRWRLRQMPSSGRDVQPPHPALDTRRGPEDFASRTVPFAVTTLCCASQLTLSSRSAWMVRSFHAGNRCAADGSDAMAVLGSRAATSVAACSRLGRKAWRYPDMSSRSTSSSSGSTSPAHHQHVCVSNCTAHSSCTQMTRRRSAVNYINVPAPARFPDSTYIAGCSLLLHALDTFMACKRYLSTGICVG